MKRSCTIEQVLLATSIAVGFSVKAQAQDNWSGFYGGISLNAPRSSVDIGSNTTHRYKSSTNEVIAGIYGGYNFTRPGGLVWGPELGLMALSNKGSKTDAALGTSNFKGSFLLTPRLRAGWASEKFYFYGAAGFGITDAGARPAGARGKEVYIGVTYGLGVEMAIRNGWSARIEAMNYDFGNPAQTFNGSSQKVENKMRVISIGLSRRF